MVVLRRSRTYDREALAAAERARLREHLIWSLAQAEKALGNLQEDHERRALQNLVHRYRGELASVETADWEELQAIDSAVRLKDAAIRVHSGVWTRELAPERADAKERRRQQSERRSNIAAARAARYKKAPVPLAQLEEELRKAKRSNPTRTQAEIWDTIARHVGLSASRVRHLLKGKVKKQRPARQHPGV
jgi:hypothetical protein